MSSSAPSAPPREPSSTSRSGLSSRRFQLRHRNSGLHFPDVRSICAAMSWYYAQDGRQLGPVSEADFEAFVKSGTITGATLVWREGFPQWTKYGELSKAAGLAVPETPPAFSTPSSPGSHGTSSINLSSTSGSSASGASVVAPESADILPASSTNWGGSSSTFSTSASALAPAPVAAAVHDATACVECGKQISQSEMVRFGDNWVCGACKAQHVQKLKEGVHVGTGFVYGGVAIRWGAKILDSLVMKGLGLVIGIVLAAILANPNSGFGIGLSTVLGLLAQAIYSSGMNWKYGATLGKKATKLKVVRSNGDPLTLGRAIGRYFAELLSAILLCYGYLMAAWDPEKRTLHDRICDTRVIKIQTPTV